MQALADEWGCDWLVPSNKDNTMMFGPNVSWKETRWITLSSFFFCIPALLFLWRAPTTAFLFPLMLICTSIVSANYWRNVQRGWRRNMDLVLAKITFAKGCLLVPADTKPRILLFFGILLLLVCYQKATTHRVLGNAKWIIYHFTFHIVLTVCAHIVLMYL